MRLEEMLTYSVCVLQDSMRLWADDIHQPSALC